MVNYVKVKVVCKCGALLKTLNNNANSGSTSTGYMNCPSCRRRVVYQVCGANAYTSYKN